MSNSKHAHLRYNILDYCFRNKSFNFEELRKHLNEKIAEVYPGEGISVRTLREDIKLFKDKYDGFNAPLVTRNRIYAYTNREFSIAQKPLLEYEQYLIDAAQQLMERFENHPKYNRLAEALIKFQEEESEEQFKVLFYDINDEYKGLQYLKPLYLAIRKKQVLEIEYKGYNDGETVRYEFHPQILKQYNRRWFVFGYNKNSDIETWSIPLDDRLVSFDIIDKKYIKLDTDWENHFRSMIGIVRPLGSSSVRVVLKFHNGRKKYFTSKPFHPDYDEFFEDDKQDQVWFETIINRELVQQLLSYGRDVEVIEPNELKNKLKDQVNKMKDYYEK